MEEPGCGAAPSVCELNCNRSLCPSGVSSLEGFMRRLFLNTALAAALSPVGQRGRGLRHQHRRHRLQHRDGHQQGHRDVDAELRSLGRRDLRSREHQRPRRVLQGTGPKVEVSAEKIAKASSDEAARTC